MREEALRGENEVTGDDACKHGGVLRSPGEAASGRGRARRRRFGQSASAAFLVLGLSSAAEATPPSAWRETAWPFLRDA